MTMRKWPFPGDSNVARARKMALAYRFQAQELLDEVRSLYAVIAEIDPRIAGWIESRNFQEFHKAATTDKPADVVADLDRRFREWGEEWHAELEVDYDDDDLINQEEAGKLVQLTGKSVGRLRQTGRIEGQFIKRDGDNFCRWYYRVGDVYTLQSERRTRDSQQGEATVTVPSDGSSDPE